MSLGALTQVRTLLCTLGLLLYTTSAFAQGISRGSIAGTVSDPTGAIVPGATVTVTHAQTGVSRTVETNASGVYAASSLPAGTYSVTVEAAGFKRQVLENVSLEAEQRLGVNVTLELGEVSETVTVTEAAPVLETETGEVAQLVSSKQVAEMPINGRNWSQYAALGSGVVSTNPNARGIGQEGNPNMAVHGQRTDKMRYAIDGIQNMDTGGQRGVNNFPPPESIQEIKFLKSNFRAESGSYGAGVGNVVTKSGGQEFHGTVYEFFRNNAMDSRNFFAPEAAPLQLNHFGFNIGGPFWLPNYNRDKTKSFFFYSQSIYKRRGPALGVPSTLTARTPPMALRQGDFSSQSTITDPMTGEPFPNNQIPASRTDPNATILLDNYYPLPNRVGGQNWVSQPKNPTDSHQELVRWDQNFTDNTRLMVRYLQDDWTQQQAKALWSSQSFDTIGSQYSKPGKNMVATLTNIINPTLINDFTFGFSWNTIHRPLIGGEERPSGLNIPEIFPDNPGNKIPDVNLSQGWGSISASNVPYDNGNPMFTFRDDLAKQAGNHSLKFGFEMLRMRKWVDSSTRPQGSFSFNGNATGHSVADFVLGEAFSYNEQEGGNLRRNWLNWQYDFYAQDDWKVTPTFTFNYGVRYSIFQSGHTGREDDGQFSFFQPALYDPAQRVTVLPNGRIVPGSGEVFNGLITPDHPRAEDFGGFDLYRTRKNNIAPRVGFAWRVRPKTVIRSGAGIYYGPGHVGREGTGRQPPFVQQVTLFETKLSDPTGGETRLTPNNINSQDPDGFASTSYQWSFGIQQELLDKTLFDITYVGNRGVHLYYRRNLNKPFPDAGRVGNVNAHRPFHGWGNLLYDEPSAASTYHALELNVKRRYGNGFMYEFAYTWSKALGHGENFGNQPQDNFNTANEWSYLGFDVPHQLVSNFYWDLPYGRTQNTVAKKIFGGWAVGGIVTIRSGFMNNVSQAGDPHRIGGGPIRPNRVGDPNENAPHTVEQWFNTAAFTRAIPGIFGNAARNIVRGPSFNNWTIAIYKNTQFTERLKMQLRGELYNAFNHTNFGGMQTNINSGIFGQITSANDPRIVQLGLRFDF